MKRQCVHSRVRCNCSDLVAVCVAALRRGGAAADGRGAAAAAARGRAALRRGAVHSAARALHLKTERLHPSAARDPQETSSVAQVSCVLASSPFCCA